MLNYIVVDYTDEVICEADTLDEIKMFLEARDILADNGYEREDLTIYKVEKIELGG